MSDQKLSISEHVRQFLSGEKGTLDTDIYRNNYKAIQVAIWREQVGKINIKLSLDEYFQIYRDTQNVLSNPDQIKRAWQAWQEQDPSLRGSKWLERQQRGSQLKDNYKNIEADD